MIEVNNFSATIYFPTYFFNLLADKKNISQKENDTIKINRMVFKIKFHIYDYIHKTFTVDSFMLLVGEKMGT